MIGPAAGLLSPACSLPPVEPFQRVFDSRITEAGLGRMAGQPSMAVTGYLSAGAAREVANKAASFPPVRLSEANVCFFTV